MLAPFQFLVDVVILLKGKILESLEFTIDLVQELAYDLHILDRCVKPCDSLLLRALCQWDPHHVHRHSL